MADTAAPPVLNTFSELEKKVLEGGRFVIFQYCFSVLVMSFKRSSDIIYLPPGEDGAGAAVSNSLISLIAGWWGIPWGPIWTIATVIKNASGGVEVTPAVLSQAVGAGRAAQIMAQRRSVPARGRGLRNFRIGLIGVAFLLPLLVMALFFFAALGGTPARTNQVAAPGQARFELMNNQINFKVRAVGIGNSQTAAVIATDFANSLKKSREVFFESSGKLRLSIDEHEFLTYCELHKSECAVIVHVPELRRFSPEAKVSLGNLAWSAAQDALRKQGVTNTSLKLAVGLRGIALYDRVLMGHVVPDADGPDSGLDATFTDSGSEQKLFPFFQPAPLQISPPEK